MTMQLVGIFGGTFDPIHLGHIQAVRAVSKELRLSMLHVVPNANPPHRKATFATAHHRLAMVRLAMTDISNVHVDERELQHAGPSYMSDTVTALRIAYDKKTSANRTALCFILGVDAFITLPTWHRWQQILQNAHVVVLQRPGYAMPTCDALPWWTTRVCDNLTVLHGTTAGIVYFAKNIFPDISASAIRKALASAHRSAQRVNHVRGLSPNVAAYINAHRLYRA